MGDPGFTRFQMQPHAAQELFRYAPGLIDTLTGRMQDHEVVGVNHDLRPVTAGKCRRDRCLQPLQGDQRQQRGDHATLRAAPRGGLTDIALHHPGLEPALDGPAQLGDGGELV
jgi:hypothetical protein